MKKDYYIYPAIFEYEGKEIIINFPDLEGCNTFGENDEDALYMAKDALGLYIACCEEGGERLPNSTPLKDIKLTSNQRAVLIEVNMPAFRDAVENTAVKKTLTIPKWLNNIAEKNNINFSGVLQAALKSYLGIKEKTK